MKLLTEFALRRPILVSVCLVVLTSIAAIGIPRTQTKVGYRTFLGEDHPSITQLDEIIESFGGGLPVFIVWDCGDSRPCDSVFDETSLRMAWQVERALSDHPGIARIESPASSAILVPDEEGFAVRTLMTDGELATNHQELVDHALRDPSWDGTLVSPNGKVGAILVQLGSTASDVSASVVPAIRAELRRYEAEGFTFRLMGDPVDFVVSGGQMQADTPRIVAVMVAFLAVATWLLLRSLAAVLISLGIAGIALLWAMGSMAWLGWPEMELTQALRPGVLVIALCDAIHFLTRYAQRSNGKGDATSSEKREWIRGACDDVAAPCLLTSVTTGAAFLSFVTSGSESFVQFGTVAAIGVAAALLLTFSALPILLLHASPSWLTSERAHASWTTVLARISDISERRPIGVLVTAGILVAASAVGISQLQVEIDERRLIGENSEVVRWATYIEEHLRRADTLEIKISTPDDVSLLEPRSMGVLVEIADSIGAIEGLGRADSPVGLFSTLRRVLHDGRDEYFGPGLTLPENAELHLLLQLAEDAPLGRWMLGQDTARISVQADALSTSDRAVVLSQVEHFLERVLPPNWEFVLSGPLPVYFEFGEVVQQTQLWSFGAASVSVSVLLWVFLWRRGLTWRAALRWAGVGMFPTLLPVAATLGAMGFLGIPLDVGTAMVGAIIVGIAVDDSVHLITAYHSARETGLSELDAMRGAVAATGMALVTSSVALSVGFFALTLSSWQSIASFGLLSGLAILGALVADLVLLPALVVLFGRGNRGRPTPSDATVTDIPSAQQRTVASIVCGAMSAAAILSLVSSGLRDPESPRPTCTVMPNGVPGPISSLSQVCPLEFGDIVMQVDEEAEISGGRAAGRSPPTSTGSIRVVRAGERIDLEIPSDSIGTTPDTVLLGLAAVAVSFSLMLGLSALWLSSAQAGLSLAPLATLLGIASAAILCERMVAPGFALHAVLAGIAPGCAIHLAMTFPRRSRILQDVPGVLLFVYGSSSVFLAVTLWGYFWHPSVWNTVTSTGLLVLALVWSRLLARGFSHSWSEDALDAARARLAGRGTLAILVLAAAWLLWSPPSASTVLASVCVALPVPVGWALIRHQFVDVRPYLRSVAVIGALSGLFAFLVACATTALLISAGFAAAADWLLLTTFLSGGFFLLQAGQWGILYTSGRFSARPDSVLHREELRLVDSLKVATSADEVCRRLAESLRVGLGASSVSATLLEADVWRTASVSGEDPVQPNQLQALRDRLRECETPVHLGPEGGETSRLGQHLRHERLAVAAPIRWTDQLLGAVFVGLASDSLPYSKQELEFIDRACRLASASIHSMRLTSDLLRVERYSTLDWVATGLMHSIGKPLSIASRAADRLGSELTLSPEVQRFTEVVKLAADEALTGVRRLREQADSNRLGDSEIWSVGMIVERAVHATAAIHHGIEIVTRLSADLPLLDCGDDLSRIVRNLLDNAVLATDGADRGPEVRAYQQSSELVVTVSDSGCGMSPEVLARAGIAFFSTRRATGGTGIGLMDARATVERLGGRLRLDSTEGVGTTAIIIIPERAFVYDS